MQNAIHNPICSVIVLCFTVAITSREFPHLHLNAVSDGRFSVAEDEARLDEMPLMMSEEGFEADDFDYHALPKAKVLVQRRGLAWFLTNGCKSPSSR